MKSWAACLFAARGVLGEIMCQDNFEETTALGGRNKTDQRLGAFLESEGHGHMYCQGMDSDDSPVQAKSEIKQGEIGFATGWMSANPYGEVRWNLEEVNGKESTLGTISIPEKYKKYVICGDGGQSEGPWQFGDVMVIENQMGGSGASITAYAFLNEDTKNEIMKDEDMFAVEVNMGFCKVEMVVKIPVNPVPDGDTTFTIYIHFHKDEGEDELNAGLEATISDTEIAIKSDLETADGSKDALTMATGVVCQSTKQKIAASDITIDNRFQDERKFTFTIAHSAVSACEYLYWDPTSVPFKGAKLTLDADPDSSSGAPSSATAALSTALVLAEMALRSL